MKSNELEGRRDFVRAFIKNHPTCSSSELYGAMAQEFDSPMSTLRSFVYREVPKEERPWEKETDCPQCGVEASGLDKIREVFGFRTMGDGKHRVQSWCRSCRSLDAQRRRKAKEKVSEAFELHEMTKREMAEQTKESLKGTLRDSGLPVSGTKSELVNRLHEFLQGAAVQDALFSAASVEMDAAVLKGKFSLKDLRAVCRFREMPVSGTKSELVNRLL